MYCTNLKIKQKKGKKFLYCNLLKQEITYDNCKCCANKEFKIKKCTVNKKNCAKYDFPIKRKPIKGKKHKLTKATEIPMKVKRIVWKRDDHKCIFCGQTVPLNCANSHVIKGSQLGRGIPENVVTACVECHDKYDFSNNSGIMKDKAIEYLRKFYDNWCEEEIIYKKY